MSKLFRMSRDHVSKWLDGCEKSLSGRRGAYDIALKKEKPWYG